MTQCSVQLHTTVTVGPKGQVVIPADVRKLLDIHEGDKLAVITKGVGDNQAIGLIKAENLPKLLAYIQEEVAHAS